MQPNGMTNMHIFLDLIGPLFLIAAAIVLRLHFSKLTNLIFFNVQGSGPMERLVPNFAYLFLFLMLFSLGS